MDRPSERLLSVFRECGGEALRDVWLFGERSFENAYVRPDVAAIGGASKEKSGCTVVAVCYDLVAHSKRSTAVW